MRKIIDVGPISGALRILCECGAADDEGSHSVSAEAILDIIDKTPELSADEILEHYNSLLQK